MSTASPTRTSAAVLARFEQWRSLVEQALEAALPSETAWPAIIHRAVRYSQFAGGKRIRPLLVLAAGRRAGAAYPAMTVAVIAVAVGECCYTTALMPLVADLAPAGLRGRYMSATSLSWWTGLALAPTLGLQLLGRSPAAAFLIAAAVAAAAGVSALTLERRLPDSARLTSRPGAAPRPR